MMECSLFSLLRFVPTEQERTVLFYLLPSIVILFCFPGKKRKFRMKFNIFLLCSILDFSIGKYTETDPFGTKTSYFAVGNSDER